MKKILVVLVAFFLFFGCVELPQPPLPVQKTPKELFKELAEKGKTLQNGKYEYVMRFGGEEMAGGAGSTTPLGSLKMDLTLYMLNEKTKTVMSLSIMGMSMVAATFERNNKTITCTESPLAYGVTAGGIKCALAEKGASVNTQISTENLEENIEKLDISLLGEKNYGERACYDFDIRMDEETMLDIVEQQAADKSIIFGSMMSTDAFVKDSTLLYNICLDKEFGFASFVDMQFIKYSELLKEETTAFEFSRELLGFDPTAVKESDFEIPVEFDLKDVLCEKNKVSFTLVSFSEIPTQDLKIKIGEQVIAAGSKQTYDIIETKVINRVGFAGERDISIETEKDLYKNSAIEVCTKKHCANTTCYVLEGKSASGECTDSDDGQNLFVKGTVTYSSAGITYDYTDYCSSDNTVVEYYCGEDGAIRTAFENCENGCLDGACK